MHEITYTPYNTAYERVASMANS